MGMVVTISGNHGGRSIILEGDRSSIVHFAELASENVRNSLPRPDSHSYSPYPSHSALPAVVDDIFWVRNSFSAQCILRGQNSHLMETSIHSLTLTMTESEFSK